MTPVTVIDFIGKWLEKVKWSEWPLITFGKEVIKSTVFIKVFVCLFIRYLKNLWVDHH